MSESSLDFVQNMVKQSVSSFNWAKDLIQGCSSHDIDEILTAQQVSFVPDLYRQFMLIMGKSSIVFERNHYYAYPHVLKFKTKTLSFLDFWKGINNHTIILPEDAFVLYEAEQAAFYYFHTKEHVDDPILFCIWEDENAFHTQTNTKLSEFLQNGLSTSIAWYRDREKHHPESLPPHR